MFLKVSTTSFPNWTRANGKTTLYKITYTDKFRKQYSKFQEKEKRQIKNKIKLLVQNPMYPSLRTKRIKGITDLFETSVNMDIRIIWYYEQDRIIMLVDIGHHHILRHY